MSVTVGFFRNHLLRSLEPADLAAISAHLQPVRLNLRDSFEQANQPIERVCFPESGMVSVVAAAGEDLRIEAGLIGFEGMTGTSLVMGDDRSPHNTYVQAEGDGHWISAEHLTSLMRGHPGVRSLFLLYVQAFTIQTAHTALANGRATLDERLARWLAMARDRFDGPELHVTHEFLALMLGVRRAGVTDALHKLEGEGVIAARRGAIRIKNRRRLEHLAAASYGVPEAEYRRLLGDPNAKQPERSAEREAG